MSASAKQRVIAALFTINFLITFSFGMNDSLFSLYLSELNAGGVVIGFAFTFYSLSKIGLSPIAGKLLDRFGAAKVLSAGLFLYMLISVSLFIINEPIYVLAVRVMQGAACALFRPVMHYVIGRITDTDGRGRAFGIFDLSFYTALAVAPVVGGFIKEYSGFDSIFVLAGGFSIVAMLILLPIFKELSFERCIQTKSNSVKKITGHPLRGIYVFIFFKGWCVVSVVILLPLYMKSLGISESFIGFLIGSSTAIMALFLPVAGILADRLKKNVLIFTGGLVYYASVVLLFRADNLHQLFFASVFCGFAGALSQPSCSSLLIELAGKNELGHVLGRFSFIMGLGASCSAFVCSIFLSYSDNLINAVFMSCLLGVLSLIVFLLMTSNKLVSYRVSPDASKTTLG